MVPPAVSKWLPLASDPFPPTHKAGSEFEGFFIRLQSHSGRSHIPQPPSNPSQQQQRRPSAESSPSRITRLTKSSPHAPGLRKGNRSSSPSSSFSSSSNAETPSPTPPSPRTSQQLSSGTISPKARASLSMLTDIDPVFASPESLLPPSSTTVAGPSVIPNPFTNKAKSTGDKAGLLPTSSPGDLILVVCELQSAPIDQRICIYLRWIVHGEEPALYQNLHNEEGCGKKGERLPTNAEGKRESFELAKYIPSWQLKLGEKVKVGAVQPFRIDLASTLDDGMDLEGGLGFMQVTEEGNVIVDLTLPNPAKAGGGTRVRVRSTKHSPWHPSQTKQRGAMGGSGPEGWIQHLGLLLPLHWYVHSTSAPALFSIEHISLSQGQRGENEAGELEKAVAAGRASLHIEKNWGQAFPSGWMWCHGSTPLLDPSLSPTTTAVEPQARVSLAGGSILGLTAFLAGIYIRKEGAGEWDWNFTPPFALGPQFSLASRAGRVHTGPGLKMTRNFPKKSFKLEVWDLTRYASIEVRGDEETFATQIPGPCKCGWTPAYCHHSYRCRAKVVLYERKKRAFLGLLVKVVWCPMKTVKAVKEFWRGGGEEGWKGLGWEKVVEVELADRVALEFGGDFAY
ncbi:hypothetical protein NDA10_007026 [Ustilago hordei]|uniref:Uncharacterized protein n=1 Tax=Ustilago hordei TaxID=120017 RepID=I2FUJ7_USTHO|nr:uncharacterized protein UHO2_05026 [Ustilago hordei]KAJ1043314.1 hypothetical protein NDA10_007026 [Ustilago hordei]UTT89248.1 hypothetical protein NDA17_003971 [Ustilago hordei]CCF50590.1 uncharacterized protein UHOR_05823 [Ustilago hordei]SYW83110.1 uncharacterized protein UHO2_05026 [Ustilago hordei]